jgi:hypothetical protein
MVVVVIAGFLIEVLAGEAQVERKHPKARRILIHQRRAKRIAVPLPALLLALIGDRPRRVQVIAVDVENN